MAVHPVEADFLRPIALPDAVATMPKLGFFPGSTLGNLGPASAVDLLRAMAATLGEDSWLLLGVDRIKSEKLLIPAYDDSQGVTAAFNLNLLDRINRELDGDIPTGSFSHEARWNPREERIEMHLVVRRDVKFNVDGERFSMLTGETIHTENSHKYSPAGLAVLLRSAGWSPFAEWSDDEGLFAVVLCQAVSEPSAP